MLKNKKLFIILFSFIILLFLTNNVFATDNELLEEEKLNCNWIKISSNDCIYYLTISGYSNSVFYYDTSNHSIYVSRGKVSVYKVIDNKNTVVLNSQNSYQFSGFIMNCDYFLYSTLDIYTWSDKNELFFAKRWK